MPHLVTLIRNLKTAVQQNDMLLNRIDMIADIAQVVIDERDDLHNWKEDYRDQIKTLDEENKRLKQEFLDYVEKVAVAPIVLTACAEEGK